MNAASSTAPAAAGRDVGRLVDLERGVIDRRIFSDEALYQMELERIFARCWLLVAHESQLVRAGDFFTTTMGEDPVLAVRQRDGAVKVLLNSCRHRGMKVCRADSGNARGFTCTYHGWAYDTAGRLVNLPFEEKGYHHELPKDEWGLVCAPQVETYKGLVFATWDPEAPPLQDYLGDMRWYMDGFLDRVPGGTEVVGGASRWRLRGNWKLAAEQFASDMYHAPVSHASARMAVTMEIDSTVTAGYQHGRPGFQFSAPQGHGIGFYTRSGDFSQQGSFAGEIVQRYEEGIRDTVIERLGKTRWQGPTASGHATIFPSASYLGGYSILRSWHPRGPHAMEATSWIIVDRSAPAAVKEAIRVYSLRNFSPSGLFEQDDGENWSEIQGVLRGHVQARYDFNYQMGMDHEGRESGEGYPGRTGYVINEMAARGLYRRWAEMMSGDAWGWAG